MTDKIPSESIPRNDPDDELLTAFLDGELSESEKTQTEKRLQSEPHLRVRLDKLRAADAFLSRLELLPVSREMTANTMEVLTGVVQKEIHAAQLRQRRNVLFFLLALGLVATVVYLAASRGFRGFFLRSDVNDRDYPVYSRLEALETVRSLGFLKQLQELPVFNAEHSEVDSSGNPPSVRGLTEPSESLAFFPGVEEKNPDKLFLKRTRYSNLSRAEREKYRALYAAIAADPDSARLEETLARFSHWFWHQITEADRYRFWAEPEEGCLELVKTILQENENRRFAARSRFGSGHPPRPFPPTGSGPHARPPDLKRMLPDELRDETLNVQEEFREFLAGRSEGQPHNRPVSPRRREIINDFIQEKGLDVFIDRLSDEGKDYIVSLPDEEKSRLIGLLIQIALVTADGENHRPPQRRESGRFSPKTESTAELAETLRSLPKDVRDELLNLPPEEMYPRLLLLHWGFGSPGGAVQGGPPREPRHNASSRQ